MRDKILVLVTCPSSSEANRLARLLVEARLAACVNIVESGVRSVYRWEGMVARAREWLLLIKTSKKRFPALRRYIEPRHSYDVPEIIAVPIISGSARYLRWLEESMRTLASSQKKKAR